MAVSVLLAHEGHAPLPSKGSKVDLAKGQVFLSAEARSALDVQSSEIATSHASDSVLAYATLVSPWQGRAFAVSRLPGRIVALYAKPGDRVEAGQILADVLSQELESLQLEVQGSGTAVRLAEQIFQGIKQSVGTIPDRDRISAEIQLQQARNRFQLAKIKWLALGLPGEKIESSLSGASSSSPSLPIRSPIAGIVLHSDIAVGKMVEPGEHLFEVTNQTSVWAKVGVLEKDVRRIAPGQQVEIQLTAYPGEVFRSTVQIVGQYLDPITHVNDVWVEFQNPDRSEPRLLPGMSGQARIVLPSIPGTKFVPHTALINDGVDRFVLVEEANAKGDSEFRKRSVVVVRETADTVEVRSAELYPGDRVVTRGSHELGAFFAPGTLKLTPETAQTIGLKVDNVSNHSVESVVEIPAAIDLPPFRRSVATARLPGTILSVQVDRGQHVATGEVLAEVFSLEFLNLQLELLRESLAAELANLEWNRLKEAREFVPNRRLIEAESLVQTAVQRKESLRRRLEIIGLSSGQLDALVEKRNVFPTMPIRTSLSGTIVSFDRVIGQSVRADEPLFEIHDLAKPWVQGFLSEQELSRVRVGQRARVRLVSDDQIVLDGNVTRSGRTFDPADRSLSIWVEFDHEIPYPLRRNQMASLTLVLETHPPLLAVPHRAVVREANRHFVFVESAGAFERREVSLGRADDRLVEIRAGLTLGDRIAVTAAEELNTAWASVK